jgi:hypothetical protein
MSKAEFRPTWRSLPKGETADSGSNEIRAGELDCWKIDTDIVPLISCSLFLAFTLSSLGDPYAKTRHFPLRNPPQHPARSTHSSQVTGNSETFREVRHILSKFTGQLRSRVELGQSPVFANVRAFRQIPDCRC